jgi:hypothetical protein
LVSRSGAPEDDLPRSGGQIPENGELVLHADMEGFGCGGAEIPLDGGELIVLAEGESGQGGPVCYSRLPLPFAPCTLHAMSQSGHEDLEIRIPIPNGRETSLGSRDTSW